MINLYYDDECPFCKEYSKYVQLRQIYDISILDARKDLQKVKFFREKGYDINDGMILEIDDKIYQGDEAIVKIDKLLKKETLLDRLRSFFTNIPYFIKIIYPPIKIFRFILLKTIGKNPTFT